jgi:phospholipid/cholesterol/gamma-HCH transport system permease protein
MAGRPTDRSVAWQVAERTLLPSRNLLEEVGEMMTLTGKTLSSALRPP